MRTLSAAHEALLATRSAPVHVRVSVKDAGGTWRDLTSYGGVDWVDAVSVNENVDEPHMTASVRLKREVESLSIARLMQDSALNRGMNPASAYAPLIASGREIKIEAGLGYESGTVPEWLTVFHGYISGTDDAADDSVTLDCRDLGARLADTYIEEERVYGFDVAVAAINGFRIWAPSTAYALDDLVIPAGKLNGHYYKVTTAGTSGAAEPAWPTSGTVSSGSAVFTREGATSTAGKPVELVMQSILNDWHPGVTLHVPVSPDWNISQFLQDRVPVLDALRALADQIGWDVRYKWRAATSQFELTFFEPDRTKTASDRTVTPEDYDDVTRLEVPIEDIRNVIRVIYPDASRDPSGHPIRKVVEVEDTASIATFGRRYMEIDEGETSQIDSATEAEKLAEAILSDLSQPGAEVEIAGPYLPGCELGDLHEVDANGVHFSTSQLLAVVAISLEFSAGQGRTHLTYRGKPSGGVVRWTQREHRLPQGAMFDASLTPQVAAHPIPGGAKLDGFLTTKAPGAGFTGIEFHVGTSAGFTPTTATLVATGAHESVEVANLTPGQTYYLKVIPYKQLPSGGIVRSQPSSEVSFTAGRVTAAHMGIPYIYKTGEGAVEYAQTTYTDDPGLPADAIISVTPKSIISGITKWSAVNNGDGSFTVTIDAAPPTEPGWLFSWMAVVNP